jgi:hypothetical protein
MTIQAIEGTGMTLTMSGGWTSDITEMKLPYSVRQAIDDTHLGDTIVRWVPSKKIEHGTMAIRFWHDPAKQLPITGDPEMMVITYPDGVNHLTVVGFVEKIGNESIKVGELMQTDALVRVIDYPKAAAVPSGSFPMWTGALTSKVVTDIMETATLRYFVDTQDNSVGSIKTTIGPAGYSLSASGLPLASKSSSVFGKPAIAMSPNATRYSGEPAGCSSFFTVNEYTMVAVMKHVPYWNPQPVDVYGNVGTGVGVSAVTCILIGKDEVSTGHKNIEIYRGTVRLKEIINNSLTDVLVVVRCKGGTCNIFINNTSYSASYTPGYVAGGGRIMFGKTIVTNVHVSDWRDWAFWNYALSDTDFDSLNDQLCKEYGIT